MKHFIFFIICMFFITISVHTETPGIPHKIAYQGVVSYLSSTSKVKYPKKGNYTLQFDFYADAAGTELAASVTQNVTVGSKGVYSTTLGENSTDLGNLSSGWELLWMKVVVTSAPTKSGLPAIPHTVPGIVQLTSVPYAYTAESVPVNADLYFRSGAAYGDALQALTAVSTTSSGTGVYAVATSSAGYGVIASSSGTGVSGNGEWAGLTGYGGTIGVFGYSDVDNGQGVIGQADIGTYPKGVVGISSSGYAGYFAGNVQVNGTLSKSAGSFKIDHPLDPANKYLSHSFVESPDMMNVYNGNVQLDENGAAVVSLPDWFGALNKEYRYQLTSVGSSAPNLYVAKEVESNQFAIAGGTPHGKVSWMVTGIRQDAYANAHRIPVEEEKQGVERGSYVQPELFGAPQEKSYYNVTTPQSASVKEHRAAFEAKLQELQKTNNK